jgi:hypothetical protein
MAGYLMLISITYARLKEYTSYTCTNTYVVKHVVLSHWLIFVLARCQVPFAIFGHFLPYRTNGVSNSNCSLIGK